MLCQRHARQLACSGLRLEGMRRGRRVLLPQPWEDSPGLGAVHGLCMHGAHGILPQVLLLLLLVGWVGEGRGRGVVRCVHGLIMLLLLLLHGKSGRLHAAMLLLRVHRVVLWRLQLPLLYGMLWDMLCMLRQAR
jgi:hypothetical protein